MHLYCDPTAGPLGAGLHQWLWRKLLPGVWGDDQAALVGGGAFDSLRLGLGNHAAIIGGGLGSAARRRRSAGKYWHVYWVRGPLTAESLRLPPETAITDGAALLPKALTVQLPKRDCVALISDQHAARFGAWPTCCDRAGIDYVDPRDDWRGIVIRLATARMVLAGSLLGAIIADTYRVPWIRVTTPASGTDSYQWRDWCASMGLDHRPVALPPSNFGEWLRGFRRESGPLGARFGRFVDDAAQGLLSASAGAPRLSRDGDVARNTERMIARLAVLDEDYRRGVFRPTASAEARSADGGSGKDVPATGIAAET